MDKKKILRVSAALNAVLIILASYLFISRYILERRVSAYEKIQFNYFNGRHSLFKVLQRKSADTVFLGDSLTDVCEWEDLFNDPGIANRAVGGAVTTDMMDVAAGVIPMRPKRIFIMIGGNDFVRGYEAGQVVANYGKLIEVIRKSLPGTKIYIQANLPTRIAPLNEKLALLRKEIRKMADGKTVFYIDLHPLFCDGSSMLKKELTYDGIHLTGEGYLVWKKALLPYMR